MGAAVALWVGARGERQGQRLPWRLISGCMAMWAAGDAVYILYDNVLGVAPPYPSPANGLYVGGYPFLLTGLGLLVRWRGRIRDDFATLDALAVAGTLGIVSWATVVQPSIADASLTLLQQLTAGASPMLDVAVLAITLRLLAGAPARSTAHGLLAAGVLLILATDVVYSLQALAGTYWSGSPLDAGWMLGYALLGSVGLHPSVRSFQDPDSRAEETADRRGLFVLPGLIAVVPFLHRVPGMTGNGRVALTFGTSLLFVAVMTRLRGLVRASRRTAARDRILSGAGNTLAAASEPAQIDDAVLEAAHDLLAGFYAREVRLARGEGDRIRMVAASRSGGIDDLDLSRLPDGVQRALAACEPVTVAGSAGGRLSRRRPMRYYAPLVSADRLAGVLTAETTRPLPDVIWAGVRALVLQASLAYDSAALDVERHARAREAGFAALVQHSSDLITIIDADGLVRWTAPSITSMLGQAPDELLGRHWSEGVTTEEAVRFADLFTKAMALPAGASVSYEGELLHKDGSPRWLHTTITNLLQDPGVGGLVATSHDLTARRAPEQQLEHQAFHDPVTGLANRLLFADRVAHALARRLRPDAEPVAVLIVDLDDFKTVNDSLGHAAGDRLLQAVAERLRACLRPADTAARLGGDEFGILLEDSGGHDAVATVAERVLAALREPLQIAGRQFSPSASIGVAVSGAAGPDAQTLLRNADAAMYEAKRNGKDGFAHYTERMHAHVVGRLDLRAELHRALERDELRLRYQPIVDLRDAQMLAVEALVRWQHPQRGLLTPADFIPMAEESGLIVPLGRWVFAEACAQQRRWRDRHGGKAPAVSINVSARQLRDPGLVADVAASLKRTGVAPRAVLLELTETVLLDSSDDVTACLHGLRALGLQLAIDDFGTGYSSLAHLHRFPPDVVKVDKSFVAELGNDAEGGLVEGILQLARTMGIDTIAEGVEHAHQRARLETLGCRLGQGYLFAAPLEAARIAELLTRLPALQGLAS